jgi:ABC-2 type transport system ATP-binding protein
VSIRTSEPYAIARELLGDEGVVSVRFEPGGLVVETTRPDAFYARVTELAASGQCGPIHEITSPDDNLQAVFRYLVKA